MRLPLVAGRGAGVLGVAAVLVVRALSFAAGVTGVAARGAAAAIAAAGGAGRKLAAVDAFGIDGAVGAVGAVAVVGDTPSFASVTNSSVPSSLRRNIALSLGFFMGVWSCRLLACTSQKIIQRAAGCQQKNRFCAKK
jgi:hypothetical protein